jgi:Caspase domain
VTTLNVEPKAVVPKIKQKALIVGIDDYPGHGNDLPSCIKDAQSITALLQSAPYGFEEIATYTNEQATIANITAGLKWLFADQTALSQNDRLVFYFSGHGYRTEKDGMLRECMCLHDGFMFDTELTQTTQSLPSGILTVILDCCHAGGMEKKFLTELMAEGESSQPVETTRIKNWFPPSEEFAKTFAAEQSTIAVKQFGCSVVTSSPGSGLGFGKVMDVNPSLSKSAEPEINGLLITACRADQTASASSSQTQGNSAFTYCLLEVIKKLGAPVSSSQLFDLVSANLATLRFQQVPVLYEPVNALGLKTKQFITLKEIVAANTPTKSLNLINTQTTGESIMSNIQTPTLNRHLTEADAKYYSDVMAASLQLVPTIYQTMNSKDFQTNGNGVAPIADGKFWGVVIGAAVSALPAIYNAVSGKDFQTASTKPVDQEKFWTDVISAAIGIVPDIIGAISGKDFQPEVSAPKFPIGALYPYPPYMSPPIVDPAMLTSIIGKSLSNSVAVAPQPVAPPVITSAPPNGADEKFWPALLAGLLPVLAGAVR